MSKKILQNRFLQRDGFIAIIALGVLGLLSIFGLIVYGIVVDTYGSVKSSNNYYAARDLSDSVIENLLFQLNSHEPGWNFDLNCKYNTGTGANGSATNPSQCATMGLDKLAGTQPVEVTIEVKGRPDDGETLKSAKCKTSAGTFDKCYVVPFAGTGTAAKKCTAYEPFNDTDTLVDPNLIGGIPTLDHADYACNWNKLTFGSSLTDRVAIPLFYENDSGIVVNPFKDGTGKNFALRLRTPCKNGADVCADGERYVLDEEDGNDIVVQWQLNGECDGEGPCGLVAVVEQTGSLAQYYSAIDEYIINSSLVDGNNKFITLETKNSGLDINSNTPIYIFPYLLNPYKLKIMSKPVFTLFLSDKLITEDGENVPYLEYQLLTNVPIGGAQTMLQATATIDGNSFIKTLWKEEQKPLIDFAVQN